MRAPEPLGPGHDLSRFACGVKALDDWPRQMATRPAAPGIVRTYVTCEAERVLGYYSLATGSVETMRAKTEGGPPDPVFVIVIGRLAVDLDFQGRGIGRGLLRDAIARIQSAASAVSVGAIVVHALDDKGAGFYRWNGFRPSPLGRRVLMLP